MARNMAITTFVTDETTTQTLDKFKGSIGALNNSHAIRQAIAFANWAVEEAGGRIITVKTPTGDKTILLAG